MTSAEGMRAENVQHFRSQDRHLIPHQTLRTGDKENINRILIKFKLVNIYEKAKAIQLVKNLLLQNRRVCHWHIIHPLCAIITCLCKIHLNIIIFSTLR